jgi:hypothetical protein
MSSLPEVSGLISGAEPRLGTALPGTATFPLTLPAQSTARMRKYQLARLVSSVSPGERPTRTALGGGVMPLAVHAPTAARLVMTPVAKVGSCDASTSMCSVPLFASAQETSAPLASATGGLGTRLLALGGTVSRYTVTELGAGVTLPARSMRQPSSRFAPVLSGPTATVPVPYGW